MRADLIVLTGTYDFRLLAISAALAILMPYAGFAVIERVRVSRAVTRWSWILAGGMAIGFGLCAALDFGILALRLSVPVRYHYPTLLMSLLLGMVCGAAGVYAATRKYEGVLQAFAASCVIGPSGAGISYLCLKSFRMPAVVEYRWGLMTVSGVFAGLAFLLVQVFAFGIQRTQSLGVLRRLMISVVTGTALVALPFGTLHSVRFYASPVEVAVARTFARSFGSLALLAGIAFCVLSGPILIATLDRVLSSQEEIFERVRERESFFNNLAEAIPAIVWIANAEGQTTYTNRNWYEMTGTDPTQELGTGWKESVHPDDLQVLTEKWQSCLRSGETFEIEYRLHDAVKGYRWYLDRTVPVRDGNCVIQQWFGTCTDIEEQKVYQQTLEQQIKERTEELADANTRLQQEMWEKDLGSADAG